MYKNDKPPAFFMRANYLDKSITSLKGFDVREFDMRDAGMSLIKAFDLLPEKMIKQLESFDKHQRNVSVGKLRKKYPEFSRKLTAHFRETMYKFLVDNKVRPDRVLSIKNDAVFIIGSFKPKYSVINDVEFVMKNKFSSYYLIGEKEFYYSCWTDELTTKGIGGEILESHLEDGLLYEMKKIIRMAENNDKDSLLFSLRRFKNQYINRELPVQCYREMNPQNEFAIKQEGSMFRYSTKRIPDETLMPKLHIDYNYVHYVAPFIGLLC